MLHRCLERGPPPPRTRESGINAPFFSRVVASLRAQSSSLVGRRQSSSVIVRGCTPVRLRTLYCLLEAYCCAPGMHVRNSNGSSRQEQSPRHAQALSLSAPGVMGNHVWGRGGRRRRTAAAQKSRSLPVFVFFSHQNYITFLTVQSANERKGSPFSLWRGSKPSLALCAGSASWGSIGWDAFRTSSPLEHVAETTNHDGESRVTKIV